MTSCPNWTICNTTEGDSVYNIKKLKPGSIVGAEVDFWLTPQGTVHVQSTSLGLGMAEFGWKHLGSSNVAYQLPEDFTQEFPPVTREVSRED